MVGTNKWTDEQVILAFDLYHKEKLQKWEIADIVNRRWPRREATSAGVNYVLNTKKKRYLELSKNLPAAAAAKPSQKTAARVAAKLAAPVAAPVIAEMYQPIPDYYYPSPVYMATTLYQNGPDLGYYSPPSPPAVAATAPQVPSPASTEPIRLPSTPLVSTLTNPAPMSVLNTPVENLEEEQVVEEEFIIDWEKCLQLNIDKWEEIEQWLN